MTVKYEVIIEFLDSILFAVLWRLDFSCTIFRSLLSCRNENKQDSYETALKLCTIFFEKYTFWQEKCWHVRTCNSEKMKKCKIKETKKLAFSENEYTFLVSCHTAWKVSKYGVFSGPYFPVFRLNTETYSLNLPIQSEYRKMRTRNDSVFGHVSCSVKFQVSRYALVSFRVFNVLKNAQVE